MTGVSVMQLLVNEKLATADKLWELIIAHPSCHEYGDPHREEYLTLRANKIDADNQVYRQGLRERGYSEEDIERRFAH